MCTSLLFKDKHSYFLRNMDLDYSFNEQIIIVPRNYKLTFKKDQTTEKIIGCIIEPKKGWGGPGVIKFIANIKENEEEKDSHQ